MTAKITNSEKNQNKKESKERKGTAGLALVILQSLLAETPAGASGCPS